MKVLTMLLYKIMIIVMVLSIMVGKMLWAIGLMMQHIKMDFKQPIKSWSKRIYNPIIQSCAKWNFNKQR